MASKHSIERYREWYAKLLRLYPKRHYERFGEGMEQTFSDLLCEHTDSGRGLFAFAFWMFLETTIAIFKEKVRAMQTNVIFRPAIGTALLLMLPAVAMRFTDDVVWGPGDFMIGGILLFGAGLSYELIARKRCAAVYRAAVALALLTATMLIWANLAVGIIGSEDNPANQMYFGVIIVEVIGVVIARFQAPGMARALFATAVAQLLVPVIALIIWKPQLTLGVVGVFGVNAFFVALFVCSALLFQRASAAQ